MKTRRPLALAAALALSSAWPCPANDCRDAGTRDPYACREVVVQLGPDAPTPEALASRHGLRLLGAIAPLGRVGFEAPPGRDVPALIDQLRRERGVERAERNGHYVSPECRQYGWGILNLGPGGGDLFRRQPALDLLAGGLPLAGSRGKTIVVAVLDTGVDPAHPALAGRVRAGIDLVTPGGLALDQGDGLDQDGDGTADDGVGHGTAVAGLVTLVAPGARILPVRILDDECRGNAFHYAAGIVAAVEAGARVLNLSLESLDTSGLVQDAVRFARDHDALIAAPVGNAGLSEVHFPARLSDTLAVAAVDRFLVAPAWTSHGSEVVLAAPGVDLVVPYRGGWAEVSGTSFATALVSGAAAAVRLADPGRDADRVMRLLEDTALTVDPHNPGLQGELGAGVPDVAAAAAAAARERGRTPPRARVLPPAGQPVRPGAAGRPHAAGD